MKIKENTRITVKNKKELDAVLEKLEKMGYRWATGDRPTSWQPKMAIVSGINLGNEMMITYDKVGEKPFFKNVITATEFLYGKECIVIYRNGKETIALDKITREKGIAKCCPDDEYNFYTGAKLAFERLTGVKEPKAPIHPNCKCSLVTEVKRAAKVGEYIKIVDSDNNEHNEYENGDILKVVKYDDDVLGCGVAYYKNEVYKYANLKEYVVLEGYKPEEKQPEFKPFLRDKVGWRYGYIGDKTPLKDVIGRELRIGDTVELYNLENECRGEKAIVYDDKAFVMGIRAGCRKDGEITHGWKIILKRRYEDIKNGEIVDGIKYIKER